MMRHRHKHGVGGVFLHTVV